MIREVCTALVVGLLVGCVRPTQKRIPRIWEGSCAIVITELQYHAWKDGRLPVSYAAIEQECIRIVHRDAPRLGDYYQWSIEKIEQKDAFPGEATCIIRYGNSKTGERGLVALPIYLLHGPSIWRPLSRWRGDKLLLVDEEWNAAHYLAEMIIIYADARREMSSDKKWPASDSDMAAEFEEAWPEWRSLRSAKHLSFDVRPRTAEIHVYSSVSGKTYRYSTYGSEKYPEVAVDHAGS